MRCWSVLDLRWPVWLPPATCGFWALGKCNQGTNSSILSSFIICKSKEPRVAAGDSARGPRVRGWGGGERPRVETERQTMDVILLINGHRFGRATYPSEIHSHLRNKPYPRPDQHPEPRTSVRSQKLVVRELGNVCLCGRYCLGLGGPARSLAQPEWSWQERPWPSCGRSS